MKKIIGIAFILFGLVLGYLGFTKMQDSQKGIEIGKLEIKAQNEDKKTESYLYMGGGVLSLLLGIGFTSNKLKK